ncbi:hypothetical protein EYF80_017143 [Liparis tanakae]|uniref:Uncharacterized protein n=1 Tax=Liparis tanakae TaxID=230148 RepID=A0A4Z2I5V5_9TELE|nr:hypothetical protein EYF80_017143 [Liparis tanakae]
MINSNKDSSGEEQEQWVLQQNVVGPAELRQGRVGGLQLPGPQLPRLKHGDGDIDANTGRVVILHPGTQVEEAGQ